MDDDQRAALVGYLLMRPVVERIELCSQVQSRPIGTFVVL